MKITPAHSNAEIEAVRDLFREYAASLDFNLCFQRFAEELSALPGMYAAPKGRLLLAVADGDVAAGCIGLRPLAEDVAELKRLYVRPNFRRRGLGKSLVQAILREAQSIGYHTVRLDTVASMKEASQLYDSLGFREIGPYYDNPMPGARFLETNLGQ